MASTHGFTLVRERDIPERSSRARLYRHVITGAELLSLENDDPNKVFGISFGTLPSDSTGVAHILEHAVLAGSRKYPLKDPFSALLKSSLATYLNASTFPDRTIYPVASQNLQDFYNLVDVYLDTVFHPLLRRQTFEQQGWHYELEAPEAALTYRGVVFNEMKGAHSSPDEMIVYRHPFAALYPDMTYGLDSGGDPRHIPDLTHEQLAAFHREYYHPSNARIFFWGDDPPEERLRLLDAYLRDFAPAQVDALPPLQLAFEQPRRAEFAYDPGEAGGPAFVVLAWALDEPDGPATALALKVLEQVLLGTPAAPLRKALTDAGLGDDVVSPGIIFELRQPALVVGLRGVPPERVDEVELLVLGALERMARDGLDPATVAAALNTVEFQLRELNSGRTPRGLELFTSLLNAWQYGRDPLDALAFEAPLAEVKQRAEAGRFFEHMIEQALLANTHRATVVLQPDAEHHARLAADEVARLRQAQALMDADALHALVEQTAALLRWQETPDPPEALATIPTLRLADIETQERRIPSVEERVGDVRTLYHELATGGIVYLDLAMDLTALSPELLPYASLIGRVLLETGAGETDFVRMAQRIGRETGGLHAELFAATRLGEGTPVVRLLLRGKATVERGAALAALVGELLSGARLDNRERVRQIVLEQKAAREAALAPEGYRFTGARLAAGLNQAGWARDRIEGAGSLFFLRRLTAQIDADWRQVQADLERVHALLVRRGALVLNVTTDAVGWRAFRPQLDALVAALPESLTSAATWPAPGGPRAEGLVIASQVNYVAKGANLYQLGYAPHGAALVAVNLVGNSWLWEQVRVQGGAYGGWSSFDRRSGVLAHFSYRDPHLLRTLGIFDRAGEYLRGLTLSDADVTRAIIGAIGELDVHMLPDAQGLAALTRALTGETSESRQQLREEILGATASDLRAFAATLDLVRDNGQVVAMGGQAALDAALAERPGWLELTRVI